MRTLTFTGLAAAIAAVAAMTAPQFKPLLIWNGSASAPPGLYRRAAGQEPMAGDWVLVRPPAQAQAMAAQRRYLPANVPLIKQVTAVSGDLVCRSADLVSRNGHPIARALDRDSAGRVLPQWSGCIRLSADQLFLINTPSHSFDSRYFGPVARNRIIERIVPLWTF